jgi:hypothetical protein
MEPGWLQRPAGFHAACGQLRSQCPAMMRPASSRAAASQHARLVAPARAGSPAAPGRRPWPGRPWQRRHGHGEPITIRAAAQAARAHNQMICTQHPAQPVRPPSGRVAGGSFTPRLSQKGAGVPVFWCFRAGFRHAGRRTGGPGERPAGRTTWRPVLVPAHTGQAREWLSGGIWAGGPVRSVVSLRARLRSSLRECPRLAAAGAWGGCACGQRDQSGRRPGRPGRGPVKPAITRCPCPCLLTRPSARWRPGRGPGRRASRRRPR